MRLAIVDVFAEQQFEGNQLAVVRDAANLSAEAMQRIAREMNFSETTFVTREAPGNATVRIFTPKQELPFAGHPTLGTAWALTGGQGEITLALAAGDVPVRFEDGIGWMTPPPVTLGATLPAADAGALLCISEEDLDPEFPIQLAAVGPSFVFVPVRSLALLQSVQLSLPVYQALLAAGHQMSCVCAFSADSYDASSDFAMRVFFDAGGIREDPATGSANSAFAAYLQAHRGTLGRVTVAQGVEIDRPSKLYLKVQEPLQVGGRVFASVEGALC